MQVEEIIQQKEWDHLTEAEKELLQPLVADEQEFNLLKKMLLFAEEDAMTTPLVDLKVQERLQQSLTGKRKVVTFKKWYYAAAAVVTIAIAGWFLLQQSAKKTKEEPVVSNEPKKLERRIDRTIDTPSIVTNRSSSHEEKNQSIPLLRVKDSVANSITTPPPIVHQQPIQPRIDTVKIDKPQLAIVNTTVKSDNTLMAFVTEVY